MTLNSPKVSVSKTPEATYNFISNIKNFEALMPENISKFEVLDDDKFLFALKGMPEIVLKKKEETPPNKIVFGAAGGKIDFSLAVNIASIDADNSDVQLEFSGDFNPMMSMMVKGPITKFIETLATNLPKTI
ncbi:MAG: SRPBCC family protein [Jejuia sp.]